jgi:hypothetical protein
MNDRELEDIVQEAALAAWRIHHDDRRNRRRLIRWAMAMRLRVMGVGVHTPE